MDDEPHEEITLSGALYFGDRLAEKWVRDMARDELRSALAAALADPAVDEGGKSLAGYLLQWLKEPPVEAGQS